MILDISLANTGSASSSNHVERRLPGRRRTLEIEEGVEINPLLSAEVELSQMPPLLIKVTGYRLLTTSIIASFGTAKALMSLEAGGSVTATWLDWILGVILAIVLYWIGLYEGVQPPVLVWFFHTDLTRDLFYLSFGVVTASIYFVLYVICHSFFLQWGIMASLALCKHIEDAILFMPFFTWVGFMLIMLISLVTVLPSMVAALLVPLLAGGIIACMIGLMLGLGGGRFKRKTNDFFVTGYQNRFYAHPMIYFIGTIPASLVICFFVTMQIPSLEWPQELQDRVNKNLQ